MTSRQEQAAPGALERVSRRSAPSAALVLGLTLGAASIVLYAAAGFSRVMLLLWLAALVSLAVHFRRVTASLPRVDRLDLLAAAAIPLALVPLYLIELHRWPVQVGSDEISIMTVAEYYAGDWGADPFGLSYYLGHPTLLFVVWGTLGELFGGRIDLETMRLLHGITGLLAVTAAYLLFRQLLPRRWAVVATLVLGLNHSLFMLSRMAMRENTVVLVEVVALGLLVRGLKHRAPLHTFLGGVVAGLGFYVYFPARSVFLVWVVFLLGLALLFRATFPLRDLARLGTVAATGCCLVALPVVVAGIKASPEQNQQQREALLVFSESRELQKDWVFASSEREGYRTNLLYGLSAFNNTVQDHAWNYPNEGHGFVDPLTGVLLWIGVAAVAVRLVRSRDDPWSLLPVAGFLLLWLVLALLVNKAPNYPRLLVTLPFVAYLAAVGLRTLCAGLLRVYRRGQLRWGRYTVPLAAAVIVGAVAAWNIAIARDFVEEGRAAGDDIGSTGRYIESQRERPGIAFAMAASDRWPYYVWGFPHMWIDRMRMFAHPGQVSDIVLPRKAAEYRAPPPFVLFMSGDLWSRAGEVLRRRYPQGRVREVTPDGSRVVFEVFGPTPR
jgi:hypothetical protein